MAIMGSEMRQTRQTKSASDGTRMLWLSPGLVRDAHIVASTYDRIDWAQVKETQCDIIHIDFPSSDAVQAASRILLEIAADQKYQRHEVIKEINSRFQAIGVPLNPRTADKKNAPQPFASAAKKLLADLSEANSASAFVEYCIKASKLHHQITVKLWKKAQISSKTGKVKNPPVAPPDREPPFWLGAANDCWIGIPIGLALAQPIVRLCYRISRVNTGETAVQLKSEEASALQLQQRLFVECKHERYYLPTDEPSDPFNQELQVILDAFIPALRKFIDSCFHPETPTDLPTAENDTTAVITTKAPTEINALAPQDSRTGQPAPQQKVAFYEDESAPTSTSSKNKSNPVEVKINSSFVVLVNGERIIPKGPATALRALAALANETTTELNVDTNVFVKLSHGVSTDVARRWYRDKEHLKKSGVMVDLVSDGNYQLNGFKIIFGINRQQIEDYLRKKLPRVRAKIPAKY